MNVTLIQCTNSKRDESAPAKHLYDESRYFRKQRRWAKARGDPWYILSAKHSLVRPDEVLAPYDERGLSAEQCVEIAVVLEDKGVDAAHIQAGRDYTDDLIPSLEAKGIDAINHFAGCGIGEREKRLVEAAEKLEGDSVVWVRGHSGTGGGVYHTDKDCPRLGIIENPIPKRKQLIEGFRDECKVCHEEQPGGGEQDHSYHQALTEASEES